jgi:hypothetical protein
LNIVRMRERGLKKERVKEREGQRKRGSKKERVKEREGQRKRVSRKDRVVKYISNKVSRVERLE